MTRRMLQYQHKKIQAHNITNKSKLNKIKVFEGQLNPIRSQQMDLVNEICL